MKIMRLHNHHARELSSAPYRLLYIKRQAGKIGYILLWLLGVPIPVLFLFYLLRGCT